MSEMPTTYLLRDLCALVQYGYTASAASTPVGPKFLRITDIVPQLIEWDRVPFCEIDAEQHAKFAVRDGDILVARTGATVGYAKRLRNPPDAVFASYLVRLRVKPEVDAGFVGAIVESEEYKKFIAANAGGAAQPNANAQVLTSFKIELPSLANQRRIASILSAYDDLIENNTRRIAILEEMARRIYEEWFVRFRFPGHENVRMVESELGPVPEGWQQAALSSILQVDKGLSYKGEGLTDSGVPMVNLKNVLPGGGFRRDGTKLYSGAFKERHVVRAGDIVVANTDLTQAGTVVGSPALVPDLGLDTVIFSHHIYAVRLNVEWQAARIWVYWMLASQSFKGFAKGHAVGTTVLGLPKEGVTNYRLAVPPDAVVQKFSVQVEPMHLLMDKLHRQIDNLRTTRDLLLPKLISGELDVSAMPEPEAAAA